MGFPKQRSEAGRVLNSYILGSTRTGISRRNTDRTAFYVRKAGCRNSYFPTAAGKPAAVSGFKRFLFMKAKAITIGILAHVDAGKTTLAEQILYQTGVVRKPGRVDHGDSFLDSNDLEKERGITIFSKQANISLEGKAVTLLDTPGHVDFSAEMERTLQVLDYAVLLISAPDGVTGHVMTLWRLLKIYMIPVIVFVNKMDQSGTDAASVMRELKEKLGDGFVALGRRESAGLFAEGGEADGSAPWPGEGEPEYAASAIGEEETAFLEEIATADEAALEEYLETDALDPETLRRLIRSRKIFPCAFSGCSCHISGNGRFLCRPCFQDYQGGRRTADLDPDDGRIAVGEGTAGKRGEGGPDPRLQWRFLYSCEGSISRRGVRAGRPFLHVRR